MKNVNFYKNVDSYEEWEEYFEGEDYAEVEPETITYQGRWSTCKEKIIKDTKDNKFYRLSWEDGSTEYQEMPWEDTYHTIERVEPYITTVTKYRKIT